MSPRASIHSRARFAASLFVVFVCAFLSLATTALRCQEHADTTSLSMEFESGQEAVTVFVDRRDVAVLLEYDEELTLSAPPVPATTSEGEALPPDPRLQFRVGQGRRLAWLACDTSAYPPPTAPTDEPEFATDIPVFQAGPDCQFTLSRDGNLREFSTPLVLSAFTNECSEPTFDGVRAEVVE